MAGVGASDLHALASTFLTACIEALDTIPDFDPTLAGSPTRAFVSPGPAALDCCDQLTVHVGSLTEGASAVAPPKASFARINRVQLIATIARCVPVPNEMMIPPTPEEQEVSAEQINADKWALWNDLYTHIRNGSLFDNCCDVIWGSLSALSPSGGCGGSQLTITVCFEGYEDTSGL